LKVVVDTSVALTWMIPESISAQAVELLDPGNTPIAPDLLLLELGNVLWKKVRKGDLTRETADRIARSVPESFDALYPAAGLVQRARNLSHDLDHPIYDLIFLALAEREGCPLVTGDGKLAKRLSGTFLEPKLHVLC
jgi:predicted nucleic acid-binding protein